MSKNTDKLKQQLVEITDVVNAFKSEAVQLRIIEKLLDLMVDEDRPEGYVPAEKRLSKPATGNGGYVHVKKKPGATKILYQLLASDFFTQARTISDIAEYCHDHYESNFKTSELSGILLKLAKENRLVRLRSQDNNRFEYVKPGAKA
ncbi:hypothetical protein [Mucilaginibacter ginkgonis]|uniref:Uncharacterized protein n=1 Tax=Mucilaginibacter ginkgonis TaxID=2682091 RepID=A0A6I4I0Z9_9SPHI|nr:hypothetical protein [Mucilaginibacter ginkgonis]QQL48446.1 hypothetical protein GO620_009595 [Mucilaginibacter ginkgonis]